MIAKLTVFVTKQFRKINISIKKLSEDFENYKSKIEKEISTLILNNQEIENNLTEKVDKFLNEIPYPKDADNEYILENIKTVVDEELKNIHTKTTYITNKSLKETEKLAIDELKRLKAVSKNELESTEKHIKNVLKDNLYKYTDETTKKLYDTIEEKIANIPPAKDGEDGKDAEVDYKAIGEMITKEISSNKSVKDIDFIKDTNEMKILYTDGTSKKLPLPKNKVIYSGSGGNTFSQTKFNSRNEIEGSFKYAYLTSFKELIYSGLSLASIEIYTDETKKIKLFTKTFIYNGDNIQNVILVDETTGYTLTKTINYNSNGVLSIKSDIIQ